MKWKYWIELVLIYVRDGNPQYKLAEQLNELGEAGWEYVESFYVDRDYKRARYLLIFKRPIEDVSVEPVP